MRSLLSSIISDTRGSTALTAAAALPVLFGLTAAEMTYSAAVSAKADMQAAMNPDEARFFSDALFASLGRGPDLMELRRNSRPFR